jgi:hypothetical protein
MCGEKFHEQTFLAHLIDRHGNDERALMWHVAKAYHQLLNGRTKYWYLK